jgi:hypothetical protein
MEMPVRQTYWRIKRHCLTGKPGHAHGLQILAPAPQRRALLGIAQLIMLGELAVNRALDNLEWVGL